MQPVSTKPDLVVDEVLKAYVGAQDLDRISRDHRLLMQAENTVGKLLERYVSRLLESKGWVWCAGDSMKDEDTIEPELLQIKNRSNSENSSSSAIRVGTTIEKWHRISSRAGNTRWDVCRESRRNLYGRRLSPVRSRRGKQTSQYKTVAATWNFSRRYVRLRCN